MSDTNYIAFGFVFGVFFTCACFALAKHKTTYEIVIEEPVVARLDITDHPMSKLK